MSRCNLQNYKGKKNVRSITNFTTQSLQMDETTASSTI